MSLLAVLSSKESLGEWPISLKSTLQLYWTNIHFSLVRPRLHPHFSKSYVV